MKFELIPLISFIAANEMKWRIKQTENIITVLTANIERNMKREMEPEWFLLLVNTFLLVNR